MASSGFEAIIRMKYSGSQLFRGPYRPKPLLRALVAAVVGTGIGFALQAADTGPSGPSSQTTVPVPPPAKNQTGNSATKPEPANPLAEQWARYKKDLSQQERGAWVAELQAKIGVGAEAQEEAQFWYGLNAQKLEHDRWKKLGSEALQKLATDGKTVWKTRARNTQLYLELQSETPDSNRLTQGKKELTNELAANARDAGAVESAVMLAQVATRLEDRDLALSAARQAIAIADYIGYRGLYTPADLKTGFDSAKQAVKAAAAAANPDKEPRATFNLAETHRLAGMTQKDMPLVNGQPDPKVALKDTAAYAYGLAQGLYTQIVEQYPEHALAELAKVRMAEIEMRTGKLKEASERLEAFLKADPTGAYRGTAHVLWGDLYLEYYFDGHRAEVEYNAVFKPSEYAKELKNLYRVAGRPFFAPDMTGDIKLATVTTDGVDPLAAEALAAADTAKQEALKAAELPEGVDPTWKEALADAHTRLGILAYMRNKLPLADQHFTTSYKMAPDTRFGKGAPTGIILLAEKCRNKLAVVPHSIMRAGGERPRIALFLAACKLGGRQSAEAAVLFKRVADGEFTDATADQRAFGQRNYAEALWYNGDGDGALAGWKRFLEPPFNRSSEAPDALLCYGASLFTTTQDFKALDYLVKVYTDYPYSEAAPLAMVQYATMTMRRDPAKALAVFHQCQQHYPKNPHSTQLPGMIAYCQHLLANPQNTEGDNP